jgi:cell division protein FtsL
MTSQAIPRPIARSRDSADSRAASAGPRIIPLIFFTILVIGVFFLMIYLRIALDRTAFELDTLTDQIAIEESAQLDLRLELAQLQDPQRIATQAQEIGLVFPDERVALVVAPISAVGESSSGEAPLSALSTDR